jgi:TPR repeat protein
MSSIGLMFEHGLGAEIDEAQALHYFSKAARKGDPNAIKNRDFIEARIAARQPHTRTP